LTDPSSSNIAVLAIDHGHQGISVAAGRPGGDSRGRPAAPAPPDVANGLNPNDPADRDGDGYINLGKYLNSLCPPP